ncbi:MAG: branched-chain amino acid transport system substrate-binding protein [Frankiaceae bacterium]|nr:branched-chain amino acid transport system substrate-binding protein [Frankiaceae bacterium]
MGPKARKVGKYRRGQSLAVVIVLFVACIVAAGCGDSGSSGNDGPVKIGLLWPFTGFASNYGPDGEAGVKLALAQAGMKVGDRKVELVTANEDVLDPSKALQAAKKLVEQDGADIVLGPVFGSSQEAVSAYLASRKVLWVAPLSGSADIAKTKSLILWPGVDTTHASPMGPYMAKELGYSKIATLAPDYIYGKNLIKGAADTFEAAGGEVVQQQWVPLGTTDLLPYASKLDKSADALVMWLVPQDAASFVRAFRGLKIDMPLIMVNGIFDPTFQEIGSEVVGELGIVDWSLGIKTPENRSFVSAFLKRNGTLPNNNNAAAYANTQLVLAAIEEAGGSTDLDDLRAVWQKIRVDTPFGPAKIGADGVAITSRTIVKATKSSDGRFVWEPVATFNNVSGP